MALNISQGQFVEIIVKTERWTFQVKMISSFVVWFLIFRLYLWQQIPDTKKLEIKPGWNHLTWNSS